MKDLAEQPAVLKITMRLKSIQFISNEEKQSTKETGKITVTATSGGLESAELSITTQ